MWSWIHDAVLERLDDPPIVEVICGFHFEPLDLDPVVVGGFWTARHDEFPKRQVVPALTSRPPTWVPGPQFQIHTGAAPLRTWLISDDDSFLIQIQHDRFYLNWRARPDKPYPRFSGPGNLLERSLAEYGRFATFCENVLKVRPKVTRIELGKVDQLQEGATWNGASDLAKMIPVLAGGLRFAEGPNGETSFRLRDEKDGAVLMLLIDSTVTFLQRPIRGIKVQSTVEMPIDATDTLQDRFHKANTVINSLFASLIPVDQRKRFTKGNQP